MHAIAKSFGDDIQMLNDENRALTTVVFRARRMDTWLLADAIEEHGWNLDRLVICGQKAIGLTVTIVNANADNHFKQALAKAIAQKDAKRVTKRELYDALLNDPSALKAYGDERFFALQATKKPE